MPIGLGDTIKSLDQKAIVFPSAGWTMATSKRIETVVKAIDEAVGYWPSKATCVKFYHGAEEKDRICIFSDNNENSEWWSTCLTADEYYWHKLSEDEKATIKKRTIREFIDRIINMTR